MVKTFSKMQKATLKSFPKKSAVMINRKQNRRLAKLENLIYPSIEWKNKDITAFDVNIPNSGYQNYPMFQLAKGDTNSTREGDKVSLRRGTLHLSLTRGDTSNIVRVLIVATPSATYAGLSDVLEYHEYDNHADGVFSSPYQVKATNSEQTYTVLADRIVQLRNDESTKVIKIPIKLPKKGKSCEFVGDSSVAPNNYNLSLLMISDSTASPHPKASYVMRWKYIDL
jgi:predicted RecA/RadA family phage recombinase